MVTIMFSVGACRERVMDHFINPETEETFFADANVACLQVILIMSDLLISKIYTLTKGKKLGEKEVQILARAAMSVRGKVLKRRQTTNQLTLPVTTKEERKFGSRLNSTFSTTLYREFFPPPRLN